MSTKQKRENEERCIQQKRGKWNDSPPPITFIPADKEADDIE